MHRLFALIAIALAPLTFAVDYEFLAGSTDKFVMVNMYGTDGTPKTGLAYTDMTITYTRNNGSADVDITEATMTMGTHADGGWIQVDSTNSPGLYQFAMPDAAIASGAESVTFSFKAASTFQRFIQASIVNVDFRGSSYVPANAVQIEGSDATSQINTEADTALTDYDGPTNAELNARTLAAASYFDPATDTVANVTTVSTLTGHTPQTADHAASIAAILADTAALDTASEVQTLIFGSATPGATAAAVSTAQSDITSILTDTAAADTSSELRTLLAGSNLAIATQSAQTTAQNDLDLLTGSDGVTLATSQPNYAPATASALSTHDGKLDTVDTNVDSILGDTNELQTRLANMIEADGLDYRFTTNALEQGPSGGGGGGDATAANQTTIIAHLTDIKGATWASTDSLESIRDEGVTAQGGITSILADTGAVDTTAELRAFITGSDTPVATAAAQTTAQSDLTAILADTGAVDTAAEMRAFLTGTDTPIAKETSIATAQADLDILTGTDGATLATTQPNYAPYTGTPPTVGAIRTELESSGTKLSLVLADTDELQTRFGLMIEADAADWRFDTNALEQAPSGGGGGSATEANQLAIIADLDEIKGTGFDTDDHSLVAIRTQGDAAWGSGGSGNTVVNHNTGGTDALRFVDGAGAGIEGATIMAYVKEDYDDGIYTMRGQATTGADGRWTANLMLDDGVEYALVFYKPGAFGPTTETVTP